MEFSYVVTSIDVKETGEGVDDVTKYGEDAQKIEFSGLIEASKDDSTVAFLMNVTQKDKEKLFDPKKKNDAIVYVGYKVSQETFRKNLVAEKKKILLCVHGFGVEPSRIMKNCSRIKETPSFDHIMIPVIWPSGGSSFTPRLRIPNPFDYFNDKDVSKEAAIAFAGVEELSGEVPLSIMAHSMGNRVLMMYAKNRESVKPSFENIFMVAPDVWEEVFNERTINKSWWPIGGNGPFGDAGLKLIKMLKNDESKVHILHYKEDMALKGSPLINGGRTRLGIWGKAPQEERNRLHKDCKDKLVDFNVEKFADEIKDATSNNHNYHYAPCAVNYYAQNM